MLDKFREGAQGPAAKIILGVVILSFALAGVGGYLGSTTAEPAAVVNGEDITRQELESAYQQERNKVEQQYGDSFAAIAADPSFAQQLRSNVLQRLVSERLTDQAIEELGLRISDEQIKESIRSMPEFQRDGQFDNDTYLAVLRQSGYQPDQFRDILRQDMTRRQLLQSYLSSEISLPGEALQLYRLQAQQRELRQLEVNVSQFNDQVSVTDEEIDAYYQANQNSFQHPEQVNLDYVLLDAADLSADVDLSEEAVKAYYQDHQSSYKAPEKRRVAHILVDLNKDNAEQEAQDLLAKVQQGEDFAELAKTFSSDTFSGENGGELDWFEKGVMDPDFEAAAFALEQVGDTSGVVKSEFGYHIIKLLEVQEDAAAPFEEVKDKIADTLKRDKAMEVFYDKLQKLSEMAFEVPDTLNEAADASGLTVQQTGLFSRDNATGDFSNAQVLVQAFNTDLRQDQMNSEVIELSPEKVMVIRVNDYQPQSTKALAEVKDDIVVRLTREKATAAANEYVDGLIAALASGADINDQLSTYGFSFSEPVTVSRMDPGASPEIAREVFTMAKPAADSVQRTKVDLLNGNIALVELLSVSEVEADVLPSAAETQQLSQFVQNTQADTSYQALIQLLQARADIVYPVVE
ncbi:peptidylprolyl isomerase [Motilimonas cestriensis]|uniref:Periplasmic chaperone PpiD n=1 Tax=Motilimonas cestriensis TaxID=2742685 RepID=A0ABS8WCE5_9GAMM|nr:peptidylprolyl isomerase [Motilimonas cestriensis]MCE2595383.1 peptidylprolyl isomerase [Motilimonas cestriensis]